MLQPGIRMKPATGNNPSKQIASAIPQNWAHRLFYTSLIAHPALTPINTKKRPTTQIWPLFNQSGTGKQDFRQQQTVQVIAYSASNTVCKLHMCNFLANFSVSLSLILPSVFLSLLALFSLKKEDLGLIKRSIQKGFLT